MVQGSAPQNFQLSTFNFQLCVVSLRHKNRINIGHGAEIAQVVERFTRNEKVAGSSPAFGSKYKKDGVCHPFVL